jgi:hypothetical protein
MRSAAQYFSYEDLVSDAPGTVRQGKSRPALGGGGSGAFEDGFDPALTGKAAEQGRTEVTFCAPTRG